MRRKTLNAMVVVALVPLAWFSWATGEWWLLAAALGGVVAGSLVGPVGRYYRQGSARRKRLLIAANQLLMGAILAVYASGIVSADGVGAPATAWLPWLPVLALPAGIFAWGIVLWRRVDAGARRA